jgi:hypothetical protein
MADQNGSATKKEEVNPAPIAEGKGKGKAAAEPAQEGGMDVDESSSEEEVDDVSHSAFMFAPKRR